MFIKEIKSNKFTAYERFNGAVAIHCNHMKEDDSRDLVLNIDELEEYIDILNKAKELLLNK